MSFCRVLHNVYAIGYVQNMYAERELQDTGREYCAYQPSPFPHQSNPPKFSKVTNAQRHNTDHAQAVTTH